MNTQKGLAPLAIVVVLALLVGGGYFGVKKLHVESTKKEVTTEQNARTQSETSDWKTYRNEEYGFELKYPVGVQEKKSGIAEVELEIQSLNPPLGIGFYVNRDSIGFAGWVDYKPKEQMSAFGTTATINYLQSEENPSARLFIALFEQDGRQYLLSARTGIESLEKKEQIFRQIVGSIKRIVMP